MRHGVTCARQRARAYDKGPAYGKDPLAGERAPNSTKPRPLSDRGP